MKGQPETAAGRALVEAVFGVTHAKPVPPKPPPVPRPELEPLDVSKSLRTALAARRISPAKYGAYLLVFVDGQPPALTSRQAFVAWADSLTHGAATVVADRLARLTLAPGQIATIRMHRAETVTGETVVGALRVHVASRGTAT